MHLTMSHFISKNYIPLLSSPLKTLLKEYCFYVNQFGIFMMPLRDFKKHYQSLTANGQVGTVVFLG
jgi:hypothetical protein